jgi:hypothetical protein
MCSEHLFPNPRSVIQHWWSEIGHSGSSVYHGSQQILQARDFVLEAIRSVWISMPLGKLHLEDIVFAVV